LYPPTLPLRAAIAAAAAFAAALGSAPGLAQAPQGQLPQVTISARADEEAAEKSYRRMVRGMDWFETHRALAPDASLRFRLYPRDRATDMGGVTLDVMGTRTMFAVPLAPDNTFTLPRNAQALEENAMVVPNRRVRSMTWRTDIRTPGLPPNVRRLGDLRLECQVGMEAGLVSEARSFMSRILSAMMDTPGYCEREDPRYLFFADKPLFSVTLVHGDRREVLPVDKLYAGASANPALREELPLCDCQLLVDRTYFLPLDDRRWPDDTRVEFEYFEDGLDATNAALPTLLGEPVTVRFDSGWQVRVYRPSAPRNVEPPEYVALLDPSGKPVKARVRQPPPRPGR